MKRLFKEIDWRPIGALALASLALASIIYFGIAIGTSMFLIL